MPGAGSRRRRFTIGTALGLAATLVLPAQAAIDVRLVSRNSNGTPANGDSSTQGAQLLSGDGNLVAFSSVANNLPGGDGSTSQAYVRNMQTGKTRLVSRKNSGDPADGGVNASAISANGRFVGFYGPGDGLPGADGSTSEVWVRDLKTKRTRLVSKSNSGEPGDGSSSSPSLSYDGRFVAFRSNADNLPGGDGFTQFIYVRDMKRGKTILASRTNTGDPAAGEAYGQLVSSDGRLVVFHSNDEDLPGGDGVVQHVYLRNLDRHRTKLLDKNNNGDIANGDSRYPSISGNGRFVVFSSMAANLPDGTGAYNEIYLRNLVTGKTKLVSRNNAGEPASAATTDGRISRNGNVVAFDSQSLNLPGGDDATFQTYARRLSTGKTRLLSRAENGDPADGDSYYPSVSPDGRFVTFDSEADNLGGNTAYTNLFRARWD